jgi:hypothetical protein
MPSQRRMTGPGMRRCRFRRSVHGKGASVPGQMGVVLSCINIRHCHREVAPMAVGLPTHSSSIWYSLSASFPMPIGGA